MNIIKNKKIAIIGGGPGGLTLARLLQMNGVNVTVYERDVNKDVRVQGATLDLHLESGLAALQEAGLMENFKAVYRPGADKLRIVDKEGTILFDDEERGKEEAFGDEAFRPEIDRGPLRKILLDSLQPDTLVWNAHLLSLEPHNSGWKLQFQSGTSAVADIVIAADGANSKVRPFITAIKPFYSGVTVIEGAVYHFEKNVPYIHKLLNGGKIFALDDAKTLIVSSKGDGSLVFYTGCKTDEDWVQKSNINFRDKAQVLAWFQQEFRGWNSIWLGLFQNANTPFIPRPQYCMPLDQTWNSLPNLTMLGDAAHLMPPYAGEGVNMAMLDALELSNCFMNEAFDVQSAIASYETAMRKRASETAAMTLQQTDSFHSANALSDTLKMFSN